MKLFLLAALLLFTKTTHSQIGGTVVAGSTGEPVQFVSIWLKNKALGATTDDNGNFHMEKANTGDTLVVSFLGFERREVLASQGMNIVLKEKIDELSEVVIIPMKSELEKVIKTYKRKGKVKERLASGENLQYSAARFFEYQSVYKKTPFIKSISFVTMNALNDRVPVMISIVKADTNGFPTDQYLLRNQIVYVDEGKKESTLELGAEKLQVPKKGFFVVLERIYTDYNRLYNKNYEEGKTIKYSYQPSFGMIKDGQAENLWWSHGGSWKSPSELASKFPFPKKDIAVNVELTN